ncbi:fibronectin type III domain-containing protein [Saccharothrix sp. NRRL B-16314]|uniref:fibronectin type III domain-containing protein n=1 Tax=Saccharothrix sp. NRRL B-16314 TaxID=1463825 RepID=UPI00068B903F|nr:fibronectin type III domain-containing protein [Saccharothrix sp. NRRL B-16314]
MTGKRSAAGASRPFVLLAVVCVAAVGAVLVGATPPLSAARFANTGHWTYNSVLGMVFHVDGATNNLDAEFPIDAEVGSQVLQSDTSGWVVGPSRITEFDKESLSPQEWAKPPSNEIPLGIEVVGGPYAVYPNTGRIVRLGDPAASIPTDGAIGNPVVTEDGTMWFHRTGKGPICTLAKDAVEVSGCPVSAPPDHAGALTVVDGRPAFLDLFTSRLHTIDGDSLGEGVDLGVLLSPNSRPAAQDANGRLAILDPGPAQSSLILVDTKTTPAQSVTVALGSGDYDGPVSTGEVVALVDRQNGTVLTYGSDGKRKDEKPLKDKAGEPRLSVGEDKRLYVEDTDGTQVLVVAEDGHVRNVEVTRKAATTAGTASGQSQKPDIALPPPPNDHRQTDQPIATTTRRPPPPVPPGRPGAPAAVSARPGNGSADVTWGAAPDNRAPITSYVVSWQGSNGQSGSVPVGGGAGAYQVNGLTNGVSYTFTVAATNQMGAGPGSSTGPVTPYAPVSPAAAPVDLRAGYDVDDRPTRDVTLTWGQPALNGGTLVHYEVTATGLGTRQVTGTQVVYPQVQARQAVTFTVYAVTRASDGQFLTGAPASATHEAVPLPQLSLSKGPPTEEDCGEKPDCAWMHVVLTGFDPNTSYHVQPYNNDNDGYTNPGYTTTTDANGNEAFDRFAYTGPGETVWVEVILPDGTPIRSNQLVW